MPMIASKIGKYWNAIADEYQEVTSISTDDFHYGPLIPGERRLRLLPFDMEGKRCLEIGCGAAQNSVFLAKLGAECVAFDISERQLEHAAELAERENVEIDLRRLSMDDPKGIDGKFDLIHSVFAVSFSKNPAKIAAFAASRLTDGGRFLLSTGHPLTQCELLEVDDESGVFVSDYFNPPPDIRYDDKGEELIRSENHTLSEIMRWITDAGMVVEKFSEPALDPAEIADAPYFSEAWMEYSEIFAKVPAAAIFVCR